MKGGSDPKGKKEEGAVAEARLSNRLIVREINGVDPHAACNEPGTEEEKGEGPEVAGQGVLLICAIPTGNAAEAEKEEHNNAQKH